MPTLVMKFGGTSVANLDRIARAAKRVALEVANGYDVIVIVSAMSGKTNELVGWVNDTSPLYDAREYDAIVSSGENVTANKAAPPPSNLRVRLSLSDCRTTCLQSNEG